MRIGVRRLDAANQEEFSFCCDAFTRGICSSRRFDKESAPIALDFWRGVFQWLVAYSAVLILVEEEDPSKFVGFVSYDSKLSVIYYVYIKYGRRCNGYATRVIGNISAKMSEKPRFAIHTSAMTHLAPKWGVVVDESLIYEPYYRQEKKS